MRTVIRYCPRCKGHTDHLVNDRLRIRWEWIRFAPIVWLLDHWIDPPRCLWCLEREHRDPD